MRKMLTWQPTSLSGHMIDTSLTEAETQALRELADGKRVLEIGSGYGYSTIVMAQVAQHVTAIDPHDGELPDSFEGMAANLAHFELEDKVKVVRAYSQTALPTFYEYAWRFEFAFIDGNHGEQVRGDVDGVRKLLHRGSYYAVHDYYEEDFPEIARVLDELEPERVVDTLWIGRV